MKAHLHDCCRGDYFRTPELRKHLAPSNMFPTVDDSLIHRSTADKHSGGRLLRYDVVYTHPMTSHMESLDMIESPLSLPSAPHPSVSSPYCAPSSHSDDLEEFADRFRQRRIKMGVTQADVGKAIVHLKLPGVGTLSQSTICRFESLTLSRNNMIALKPVLESWLEAAEMKPTDREKKRTSITALERRSLEAYFSLQQRPSSEKIASIAHKLDLKKSVVRVWFCNQRQKQKRMKYA